MILNPLRFQRFTSRTLETQFIRTRAVVVKTRHAVVAAHNASRHNGDAMDTLDSPTSLCEIDPSLIDGEYYWLGATIGRYNAEDQTFDLGNTFVHRGDTMYADNWTWEDPEPVRRRSRTMTSTKVSSKLASHGLLGLKLRRQTALRETIMGGKLEILRVRIKVSLPGQKWSNRTVVMTDAGELVAVLPENAYTQSMDLTEDRPDPIFSPTRKFLSEADEEIDPELGW